MSMLIADRLIAPSRGSPEEAITYAESHGAKRIPFTRAVLNETYRLCAPDDMPDASLVVARMADETGGPNGTIFVSPIYEERGNPGGLGVTDGGDAGLVFPTPETAARAMVAHTLLYATGEIDRGGLKPADDPRYSAYRNAYGNRAAAETLQALTGKWFTNPEGAINSAARGNAIFPNIPDQGGTTVPLTIDVDLTNRMNVPLRDKQAFITVHNTGNSVPRQSERIFVNGGGGTEGVAYHFAVDETGATQIMPLWKRGVHSGNAEGNATSIAIEMCELREPWSDIKEHTAQLLAAIVLRDSRIRFDSSAYEFSLDRVREHRDWPGANPGCPRRLIQTDGGVEKIVARARAIVAGDDPNPVVVVPHAVGGKSGENWVDESGNEWVWLYRMVNPANPVQTYEYANVLSGKGPVLPAEKRVRAYRAVAANGPDETPEIWVTTKLGWRFLMSEALAA